jgi:hypothetical protein
MKKIAWLAPILIAGPLAFVACDGGGTEDVDGSGGSDGTGGNDPTGGNGNDGTGGGSDGTGGGSGGTTGGTGGVGSGGEGGIGGLGGMGGMGGGSPLSDACAAMCAAGEAGDASDCDEATCVEFCVSDGEYFATMECGEEFLELTECSAELDGDEFFCEFEIVGVTGCVSEQQALVACYE